MPALVPAFFLHDHSLQITTTASVRFLSIIQSSDRSLFNRQLSITKSAVTSLAVYLFVPAA
jgi:hypothetical protein